MLHACSHGLSCSTLLAGMQNAPSRRRHHRHLEGQWAVSVGCKTEIWVRGFAYVALLCAINSKRRRDAVQRHCCCSHSPCCSSVERKSPSQMLPFKHPFAAHDDRCANAGRPVCRGLACQLARVLLPASLKRADSELLFSSFFFSLAFCRV